MGETGLRYIDPALQNIITTLGRPGRKARKGLTVPWDEFRLGIRDMSRLLVRSLTHSLPSKAAGKGVSPITCIATPVDSFFLKCY